MTSKFSILVIAACVLSLTACSTAAQRQASQMQKTLVPAKEELKSCVAAIYHKPEYKPLVPHLLSPDNDFEPTAEQLADDTYPTKKEGHLLFAHHDEVLRCRQSYLKQVQTMAPDIAQVLSESSAQSDRVLITLAKRHITWGAAAQEMQQIALETNKRVLAAARHIETDLAAAHQAELNQRKVALDEMQQWSAQQQAAQQPATRIMCTNNSMASGRMPNPTLCQSY